MKTLTLIVQFIASYCQQRNYAQADDLIAVQKDTIIDDTLWDKMIDNRPYG